MDIFSEATRALARFYALRPISEEEWRRGLAERFAADDCTGAEPALDRIVELGFERALEGDRPTMEQVVERVRLLHKHGLTVVRAVAAGESPPRRLHPGVRDRVLKLLRNAGVVEREARGRWRVIDPLLRHYLASLDPFGP